MAYQISVSIHVVFSFTKNPTDIGGLGISLTNESVICNT